jgi:hypothetical protein
MRCLPGSINIPVAKFPAIANSGAKVNAVDIAESVVSSLNDALASNDAPRRLATLFDEDGYWRDHLALTWRFRTAHTPTGIHGFLQSCAQSRDGLRLKKVSLNKSSEVKAPKVVPIDAEGETSGIQLFVTFETALGSGQGLIRVVEHAQGWKIFTLYTKLEELRGYEEPRGAGRTKGVEHGGKPGRKNWAERRALSSNFEDGTQPAVVVIGKSSASESSQ